MSKPHIKSNNSNTSSKQPLTCKWNVHNPQSNLVENEEMAFWNYGWTLVDADNNQASSCCATRSLKTLDLFPLTTTIINEDCTTPPKTLDLFPLITTRINEDCTTPPK
ncbi:hypothetical protein GLYMA_10G187551v4 [Glycine max]|nr:hypothetical protein GLYMA_10G187551v4 [Glycine max]KAH1138973.1 hypothetical protein GYH30_028429 [Glycine max]